MHHISLEQGLNGNHRHIETGIVLPTQEEELQPMTFETVTVAVPQHEAVNEFYDRMHTEFSRAIHGEEAAKDAAITSIVMGQPLLLSGLPGGGKSTLSEMMPRIVAGVEDEHIALISGQHDLTGNQIVGGEVVTTKEIEDKLGTDRETMRTVINGIVKAHTMFLRLEEMNGINPNALRSLLPVLENKRVENAAGEVFMDDLITVVGTMNPTESSQSTFSISDAMASRFSIGAVMGVKGSRQERMEKQKAVRMLERLNRREDGSKILPRDLVKPVVEARDLSKVRNYVMLTKTDALVESKIDEMAIDTADTLAQMDIIEETDNRLSKQIEMNAKVLGGLRNSDHTVHEKDLHDAVRTVVVARAGALQNITEFDLENTVRGITKL